MLPDHVGMNIESTRTNVKKQNDAINVETRIHSSLNNINERLKNVYSSSSSSKLITNNNNIEKSLYTKIKNLKSFKVYTEKYIGNYVTASNQAVQASAHLSSDYKI